MSDPVLHGFIDSAGQPQQSMESSQSAWMSHWTKKSYDEAIQNRICSSTKSLGKKEHAHGNNEFLLMANLDSASNTFGQVEGLGKILIGTSEVTNDSLRMTSKAIRSENLVLHTFPTDNPCQNGERSSALKDSKHTRNLEVKCPEIKLNPENEKALTIRRGSVPSSMLLMAPDTKDNSSREYHSQPDDESQSKKQPVKTLELFSDRGFDMSRPSAEDLRASTSHNQHAFDHGDDRTNFLPSDRDRSPSASKEQLQHIDLRFLEHDYQRHSAVWISEEKIGSQSKTERSERSCLRQDRGLSLQTNPSTSSYHFPTFGGEQFQNIQNFSGFRLSQNQSKLPEVTKSQKLHQGYSSVPKFGHSIRDAKTMRISTPLDPVVGVEGGHPEFSQSSRSLFITKMTDFDLNNRNETIRNARAFSEGDVLGGFHNRSPPLGVGKKGEMLQPVGGSKDSEVEEYAENAKALSKFTKGEQKNVHYDKTKMVEYDIVLDSNQKNESSAETDIMELDEFEEKNQLSAANSSPSNKIMKLGSVAPRLALGSTREVGYAQLGMNFGLPALPAAGKWLDNGEPSTSRTQSLDMETLLANAEQLSHSDTEHYLGGSAKPEPSCIWVKRLKLSTSDSFIGTKSSNSEPSYRKNNLVLARNLTGTTVNSEPSGSRYHGKDLMVLGKTTALSRRGECSSSETIKDMDSLSNSWIRRWHHCQAATPKKEPQPVVVCEAQSSKLAVEDQRKQFPSIAAMALMGKAMSGFQPCQFQKKGSVVIWH